MAYLGQKSRRIDTDSAATVPAANRTNPFVFPPIALVLQSSGSFRFPARIEFDSQPRRFR
jgi:hypothetical protein